MQSVDILSVMIALLTLNPLSIDACPWLRVKTNLMADARSGYFIIFMSVK